MAIKHTQLSKQLSTSTLAPVYLISGDDTLLCQEARDHIRESAKQQGFTQYQLLSVTSQFDWQSLQSLLQNFSLFAEKQVIDLRHPTAKFEKSAIAILDNYLNNNITDTVLIISTDKLTAAQKRAQWYQHMDKKGVVIDVWPIATRELPQWVMQRLKAQGNEADHHAITTIIELTEGNLLATQQVIDKVALLYPNQAVTETQIQSIVSDNARFSVFDLTNYCLIGNTKRALRILQRLKEIGVEPTLILWSLTREIREVIKLQFEIDHGVSVQQALSKQWASRKTLLQSALRRCKKTQLTTLLPLSAQCDQTIKGARKGCVWDILAQIIVGFSAKPLLQGTAS